MTARHDSVPPPPTPATIEGVAKNLDEIRAMVHRSLKRELNAAQAVSDVRGQLANALVEIEKRQAPPAAAVWVQAAGVMLASLSTTAIVALLAWWMLAAPPSQANPPPQPARTYSYAYPMVGP